MFLSAGRTSQFVRVTGDIKDFSKFYGDVVYGSSGAVKLDTSVY